MNWFIEHTGIAGLMTVLLMWLDWILTLAQEKERKIHYQEHYRSYPVNTIEGNHIVRQDVEKLRLLNPRHILISIAVGLFVWIFLQKIPPDAALVFTGYLWGLFLIVNTQHLSNLTGYRFSRKGLHGKIWMHQRTGYLVQSGRYFATFIFLFLLSLLIENLFLWGVTLAALVSSLRMFIWIRKVPRIAEGDPPPENQSG